jgi:hypothetical protein
MPVHANLIDFVKKSLYAFSVMQYSGCNYVTFDFKAKKEDAMSRMDTLLKHIVCSLDTFYVFQSLIK